MLKDEIVRPYTCHDTIRILYIYIYIYVCVDNKWGIYLWGSALPWAQKNMHKKIYCSRARGGWGAGRVLYYRNKIEIFLYFFKLTKIKIQRTQNLRNLKSQKMKSLIIK